MLHVHHAFSCISLPVVAFWFRPLLHTKNSILKLSIPFIEKKELKLSIHLYSCKLKSNFHYS